ncbi:DUF3857 and transglutaminase domain-containing protein [Paraflavitalea sp. CAU 1676]|uniref:DUF3857 and transglutaminase domain-containing protein n=1 Tax=Paraflavitalea sp. CAU 1676 TaxID=3032598 RepID=UPI0023DA8F53|nr:DUF3857 and transglutaminase domain-containing protein [Paraflavitalea sp. CAU 1676]MDF2188028.1 DUF3857 and transglutaminase domain-containing protein [Paraflavitalea sp. CAU 1676]
MRKRLLLTLPVLALALLTKAQPVSLDAATIPEALKKNAHVVKRYEHSFYEITDIDKAYYKVQEIFTVLDADGADKLEWGIHFDNKFFFFEDVEIKVYDKLGKQINKYKKKDLITYGGGSGESLIDDNKSAYIRIPAPSYPVTVDITYEKKFKGSLFMPSYDIIGTDEAIQQSIFTVKVPKGLDLRYKEQNIKLSPKITEDEKYKTYEWSVSNLPAIESEEGTAGYEYLYPRIILAATKFKMGAYEGDMTSWKNLGIWYNEMHKGLDVLPEDRKVFLNNLVKDAKDDAEKVRIIYNYLQNNFRYVAISLGIGGWRSLPADFTDQKKYGDCKGLTNYMQAALKAVGVRSHAVLIKSQVNTIPLDPGFPMNDFNHVILCVPQAKDTIWLECTSKVIDFNFLSSSTENRNALVITENGGALVATPTSRASANKFDVHTTVALEADGSGKVVSSLTGTGRFKMLIDAIIAEKKDDQKTFIINGLGYKQPDEFSLLKKENSAIIGADLEMAVEKIPEFIAGNKMFLSPRQHKIGGYKLPKAENRKRDYYFTSPYTNTDTTLIQLPEGFVVDALPQTKDFRCDYASYHTKCWYDESKKAILSTTSLTLHQQKIPAADYAAVKKFFEDVNLDDAQRIVIKKQ